MTITPGPVGDLAATLRDGEGTAWLVGGGGLFAAFAAAGLIDLWIVTVIPVMLGGGVPLLPAGGDATSASSSSRAARSPAAACSSTTARGADVALLPTPLLHRAGATVTVRAGARAATRRGARARPRRGSS